MRRFVSLLAGAALLAVGGCSTPGDEMPDDPEAGNVIFSSYRAADQLISLAGDRLDPSQPVLVATLADINDLEASSPFGRLVAEQLASRLVNAGFTVVEVKMRDSLWVKRGTGQLMLSRDALELSESSGAQAVLAGTYTPAPETVYINLKLIRAEDGRVMGAYDYAVDATRDIEHLADFKKYWQRAR